MRFEVSRDDLMELGGDAQERIRSGQVAFRRLNSQPVLPWSSVTELIVATYAADSGSPRARISSLGRSHLEDNLRLCEALSLVRMPVMVPINPDISIIDS
jgi:hypothetical protein